jgi:FixJ family two-component response regulator
LQIERETGMPKCLVPEAPMPEMTGSELVRVLCERGEQIPTVLTSGNADEALQQCVQKAGVNLPEETVFRRATFGIDP